MKLSTVAIVLLTRAFIGELSEALNVTVTPGPVSMCMEGDNITLSCLVSQRKRSSHVLVLRWLYFPTPEDEHLVVRMGMKKSKYYGNYSKHFPQSKFHLWEEMDGQIYHLLILNVSLEDRGNYTCKVQEIRKHRNKWRASSNGTGSMELRVHRIPSTGKADVIWRMFEVQERQLPVCPAPLLQCTEKRDDTNRSSETSLNSYHHHRYQLKHLYQESHVGPNF
uniref:V-set and transmembrane domain containing 4a n=1 Tax=Cyprinus carpio carpio TaxID=630221 RepID=A0A8C1BZZ4_CYPCA